MPKKLNINPILLVGGIGTLAFIAYRYGQGNQPTVDFTGLTKAELGQRLTELIRALGAEPAPSAMPNQNNGASEPGTTQTPPTQPVEINPQNTKPPKPINLPAPGGSGEGILARGGNNRVFIGATTKFDMRRGR